MPTAACAIRTRTDAIQLASTLEGDCEQELTRLDQRDGGLMTAGAPAKSHHLTARGVGIDGSWAEAATTKTSMSTRTQPVRSAPHPLHGASRTRSDLRARADALHTRRQSSAPNHARRGMYRITPPGVTRC